MIDSCKYEDNRETANTFAYSRISTFPPTRSWETYSSVNPYTESLMNHFSTFLPLNNYRKTRGDEA